MADKGPLFVKEMKDVSELEDSTVVFSVKITGDKPLNVTWHDEDGPLNVEDKHYSIEEDEDEGVYELSIHEVEFENDSGIYKCEATNKLGKTISEATLYIEEMPDTAKQLVHKVEHKV